MWWRWARASTRALRLTLATTAGETHQCNTAQNEIQHTGWLGYGGYRWHRPGRWQAKGVARVTFVSRRTRRVQEYRPAEIR